MTESPDAKAADLARDWTTIWQSEMSAAAADRERAETWARTITVWNQMVACFTAPQGRDDGQAGQAARPSPARPAPADAAPDASDAATHALVRSIDELERRLAALERPDGG